MDLWEQTQSCLGLVNHKMTGISWLISMAFSLLLKRTLFSPKCEAQSLICFGSLEEMDELDVLRGQTGTNIQFEEQT